ncbi:hypothetical protein [Aquimarina sp. RZ0]|uniref:hypothetical protein n=1 Tax=Aquimarina sp. RZ0 TaxID=2607730 RepID=UPI0011F10B68|nr:hypothetical protein [Aquimarina sp. RZ0]KAA1244680.1 hypothetical protein F0000_15655 [Aquimarina sp. RZ0]
MKSILSESSWVYNKKEDFKWVIFPALIGFAIIMVYQLMLYFNLPTELSMVIIFLTWACLFDGTHSFATYTRTYFDKSYYKKNKGFLLKSLLLFLVAPLYVLFFYFSNSSIEEASAAYVIFNRFAFFYAFYHLVRQHWGFVAIYRKKNNEKDTLSRRLDGTLLATGTIFPIIYNQIDKSYLLHVSETINISLQIWEKVANSLLIVGVIIFILSQFKILNLKKIGLHTISKLLILSALAVNLILQFTLPVCLKYFSIILGAIFILAIGYYFLLNLKKEYSFKKNLPKWLLMITVILSYNIIFMMDIPIIIVIAAITVFHNIQYHRIINFHNTNKYKKEDKKVYGFAVVLTQRIGVFILFALLSNFFYHLPRFASNLITENLLLNYILSGFFWGFAFHHYYLDSVIWKLKGNNELDKDLKITNK